MWPNTQSKVSEKLHFLLEIFRKTNISYPSGVRNIIFSENFDYGYAVTFTEEILDEKLHFWCSECDFLHEIFLCTIIREIYRSHKTVKHTQAIRRQTVDKLFECVWPFCWAGAERVNS